MHADYSDPRRIIGSSILLRIFETKGRITKITCRSALGLGLAALLLSANFAFAGSCCPSHGTSKNTSQKAVENDDVQADRAVAVSSGQAVPTVTVVGTKVCVVDGKSVTCMVYADGTCRSEDGSQICKLDHAAVCAGHGDQACKASCIKPIGAAKSALKSDACAPGCSKPCCASAKTKSCAPGCVKTCGPKSLGKTRKTS